MAFDVVGRLIIKDEMSGKLRKVQSQLEATSRSTGAFSDHLRTLGKRNDTFSAGAERASRMLSSMTKGFSSAGSGASRLSDSVGLLAAGYLTAQTAASAFNKTIGAAAQYEMREVTLSAMFGSESKKNVNSFLGYLESRADVSQYSMDDFLDVGKSFVPTTKDLRQLERATNLAERLGAIDPEQGITGAAYALKEFFSGDAVSLVERFELPRSELNKIKNLPLKDQLDQLDKFLDKLGATNELIDAQSKTAMGQWRTAIGGVNRAFREMGTDALTSIKPMLTEFNNWIKGPQFTALKTWGVDAFGGLVSGAVTAVREATSYIQTHFINNPQFQRLPDIPSKIKFIFEDISKTFQKWLNAGGTNKIQEMSRRAIDILGESLQASQPLIEAAMTLGTQVGIAITKGVGQGLGKLLIGDKGIDMVQNTFSDAQLVKIGGKLPDAVKERNASGAYWVGHKALGHSSGLDRVPYNNYPARLHQDEMVLNSQEARDYRNGESGGKTAPTITIQTVNVNNGMDYNSFVGRLAHDLANY
ncbi:hypothetical protein [Paenibacillus xylanilyticus]|uniref:hypothetical protein n=1 Tax=Paenibacillus xylanilyticus TaxID=248903 RepID=UPI003AAD4D42